jgi:hypothetical protein
MLKAMWSGMRCLCSPAVTLAASRSLPIAADGTRVRSAALWRNSDGKEKTKVIIDLVIFSLQNLLYYEYKMHNTYLRSSTWVSQAN